MSSKKNKTAVHGCNPAISVLVVLVSHKVYFLCSTISLAVLFVTRFESEAKGNSEMAYRPFALGLFVAPFTDHLMILLRILAFKFSNSRVYMNE